MAQETLTPWERLIGLLTLERKDIFQIFYYAVFAGLVALSLPLGIQAIINLIQGAQISTSWVVLVSLVTLGTVFSGILQLMQLRIIETIQQRIFVKTSFELTYRFPKIKMEAFRNNYPPELANRFFDTLIIQKGLNKILIDVPAALLQVLLALILLSFYHPVFIAFGFVLLFAVFLVFQYTAKKGLLTSLEESKFKYKVAHWIQEIARSTISFKQSGRTNLALRKNDDLVEKYLNAREKHFGIIKLQYIKLIVFKGIITAGILVLGGVLVLQQKLNIGQFVAAEIIILLVITSIEKLILGLETLYDLLTSIQKLGQVVDMPLESQAGSKLDFGNAMHIELERVYYTTPEKEAPILKNISLQVNPTSRILVQGASGAGKSSLMRLLSGSINPTQGNVFVNNLSLEGINRNHYRAHLGLALSEEVAFEGTLRENLTFGDASISDNQIYAVFEVLGMTSVLKELPYGLETILFPEGKQLSKTLVNKIVLARAILKQPHVLIIEDQLDPFNEAETQTIIDYLASPERPWALVVVAKNEYWKTYCKEVIYLKKGELLDK